jgi:hypothetical protein
MVEAKGHSKRIPFPQVDDSLEPFSQLRSGNRAKGWQSITDEEFFSINFWGGDHGKIRHVQAERSPYEWGHPINEYTVIQGITSVKKASQW